MKSNSMVLCSYAVMFSHADIKQGESWIKHDIYDQVRSYYNDKGCYLRQK